VRDWVRKNRDPLAGSGIQWSFDSEAKNLPLALCWQPPGRPPDRGAIARVSMTASTLIAFDAAGAELWRRHAGGDVVRAQLADLDADGEPEVVAATRIAIS